jgi:NAD(P)-dependent dehydrogenase (short-subunit alcohol dehydrogenase family)
VVLAGRTRSRLEGVQGRIVAAGGVADVLEWDLGDGDTAASLVEATAEVAGQLDVLVHSAGNQVRMPALELPLASWDAVLGLHLRAAFALSQATGRHLVERGAPGTILYVGSMTSQRAGLPNTVAYGTAKSGLLGLTRTLAVEWAPYGIRVNAILVGFVQTDMTRDIDETPARKAMTSRIPWGRLGTPDEIGDLAAFLASDMAGYITGESVNVDGGWSVA